MWVHDLRDADEHCGGKAQGLAKLIRAGLPVPSGFVIDDRAFRSVVGDIDVTTEELGHALEQAAQRIATAELPEDFVAEVSRRAAELGERVMVRSSATIEDSAAGAAAGVFSSRAAVPLAELWDAIRAVWTSALTPLAAAYARKRGGAIAIGVIVQEYVAGEVVTVYTRPPGDPKGNDALVQRGDGLVRYPRTTSMPRDWCADQALRAEEAIAAPLGADVEIMCRNEVVNEREMTRMFIVQARPIVHPAVQKLVPAPPAVVSVLEDGRVWTWAVAHNPDPLSIAQQELVARVAEIGAYSLRVCGGYLYTSPREHVATPAISTELELAARAHPLETQLEALLADPPRELDAALARYVEIYRVWSELGALVAAARAVLPAAVGDTAIAAALVVGRPSAVETALYAAARGELAEGLVFARFGQLAPAWDVAVPSFREQPKLVHDAIARARAAPLPVRAAVPTRYHADHAREIELAIAAADLAERDDLLFSRAQLMIRCALLDIASSRVVRDSLGRAPCDIDDIFWVRFDEHALPPLELHRRAAANRAAAERAARWQMPLVVGGPPPPEREPLHGVGTGPRVTGRVVRFASLASAIAVGPGDVVVTRAVTPALAVLVAGCAALVSETGGLLDHGAALARELGIPCVVGCAHAWSELADGMIVTVDGNAGEVTKT